MKKGDLWTGIIYLLVGLVFLVMAFWGETGIEAFFAGFAGAGIGPGLTLIGRYFYWTRPKNVSRYQERLEVKQIDAHDELKIILRDKSGRYAYLLGLGVLWLSIIIIFILGIYDAMDFAISRALVIFLGGYLLFQFIIGFVIYKQLLKRY